MKAELDFIERAETQINGLEQDRSVVYLLDKDLRLTYCNQAWDDFAEHNGGAQLSRIEMVGYPVLDATPEPLKTFYRFVFERTLAEQQAWEHSYECSSPKLFREFHMRVLPLQTPPRLVVVNSLVVEKDHERVVRRPLTVLYRDANGVIGMCMHCRRTRRSDDPDVWDWVPDFLSAPPDNISHGLCSMCFSYYYPQMNP